MNDTVRRESISIMEEEAYRFINPLCEVCVVLDVIRERVPAPCGPTSSLHPRSIVREDKNKEEIKEAIRKVLCAKSTKNHCEDRTL